MSIPHLLSFTVCGTPHYMAPELLRFRTHSLPVDMWAVGVLLHEMLRGCTPFGGSRKDESAINIYHDIIAFANGDGSFLRSGNLVSWIMSREERACTDLIRQLLSVDPRHRPTAKEAIDHWAFEAFPLLTIEKRLMQSPFVPPALSDRSDASFTKMDPAQTALRSAVSAKVKVREADLRGFAVSTGWGHLEDIEAETFARGEADTHSTKKRRGSAVRNRSSHLDATPQEHQLHDNGQGLALTIGHAVAEYDAMSFAKAEKRTKASKSKSPLPQVRSSISLAGSEA